MTRIIFHIDVNSAYLSWTAVEQLKNHHLPNPMEFRLVNLL